MPRELIAKNLVDTRLASGHGGWIYCGSCDENIGYLCYVTYDSFYFSYKCKCGSCGKMYLAFRQDTEEADNSNEQPVIIKNRLCCPKDNSPLFTVLYKKLQSYEYTVACSKCGKKYSQKILP